jgi:S-adenosylmethionine uptake transporter
MTGQASSHAVPLLIAALGIASFTAMDAVMKDLSIAIGAYNAMLWRGLPALALSGALFCWRGSGWPSPAVLKLHLWRGLVTSPMAFLFFWGLTHVPLAEAVALSFVAPLIALYLARVLLGETIGAQAVIASLIGMAGALLIIAGRLGGTLDRDSLFGVLAILLSAFLYAYNLILQRRQAIAARPFEIAFFQTGTVALVYLLFSPWLAVPPPAAAWPGLTGAAVLGLASLMMLSWAYGRAETRILIPVEYTAFAWAALLGWLLFDEAVTATTLAGTALIVLGCLRAARQ